MFMPHTTIDEIANIRQKITELRAREMALETRLVSKANSGVLVGLTANARVEINVHEVFDIAKLPTEILNDPQYYTTRQVTSLRIDPHEDIKDVSPFSETAAQFSQANNHQQRHLLKQH